MKLQVTGKNLDVTDPIVDTGAQATKLTSISATRARVELELAVERSPSISDSQVAEATVWTKGPVLRARESSTDMYASIDLLDDELERQVSATASDVTAVVRITRLGRRPLPDRAVDDGELPPVDGPDRAADRQDEAVQHEADAVPEAALQLELVGHDFFVHHSDTDESPSLTSAATATTAS